MILLPRLKNEKKPPSSLLSLDLASFQPDLFLSISLSLFLQSAFVRLCWPRWSMCAQTGAACQPQHYYLPTQPQKAQFGLLSLSLSTDFYLALTFGIYRIHRSLLFVEKLTLFLFCVPHLIFAGLLFINHFHCPKRPSPSYFFISHGPPLFQKD